MGKTRAFVILLVGLAAILPVPACKEKPKNPVAEYGDTLINTYKGAQDAADVATLDGLRKAVQAYRTANGSYPAELKDVECLLGGPVDLGNFLYDPATGTVALKPQK